MENKMMSQSCTEFCEALASKHSVPGGGGASAYVGALGAALVSMVAHISSGKGDAILYERDIEDMLKEAQTIQTNLLRLVDDDAQAFSKLSHAYTLAKDDPQRTEALEAGMREALEPPLTMMNEIAKTVKLLEDILQISSATIISDVGCSASLCAGAMQAAALSVFANTQGMQDRMYADEVNETCSSILDTYLPRAEKIYKKVMHTLRG